MQEHHIVKNQPFLGRDGVIGETVGFPIKNQPFSIVCNSIDGLGSGKNSLDYTFNFGEKFQGRYELTFSFFSENSVNHVHPLLLNISGLNGSNFEGNQKNNQSVSNVIGIVKILDDTNDYLYAGSSDNPPVNITLSGQNQFNISLLNFDKTLWSVVNSDYVCILHFKSV
jgi:hypothetical protein